MFQPLDRYNGLSLLLSEVLSDIGVNERMVEIRSKMIRLIESLDSLEFMSSGEFKLKYYFGSQSEGSTTEGLRSDLDAVITDYNKEAIQDLHQWQPGKLQVLMIQDDRTSPGYCLLQAVRRDEPLPFQGLPDKPYTVYNDGRVLVSHSVFVELLNATQVRHGPAVTEYFGSNGPGVDTVTAFPCFTWPKEAIPWLQRQHVSCWPTTEMKRCAEIKKCFVVPVASKTSVYPDLEWRISTSNAERCLMFNLNITQMRCYILMKMIRKTYIDPVFMDVISSFICKNVLFWCIAESPAELWTEPFLIERLIQCLEALLNCVRTGHCPHFIIPGNNLLAGKLTVAIKVSLAWTMCFMIRNIELSVLSISIDDLGERIRVKSGGLPRRVLCTADEVACSVSARLVLSLAGGVHVYHINVLCNAKHMNVSITCKYLTQQISLLQSLYRNASTMGKTACDLVAPFLYTQLGSIMASEDIRDSRGISHQALELFTEMDGPYSWLKLASALYCSGDIEKSIDKLEAVKKEVDQTLTYSFCRCYQPPIEKDVVEFERMCYEKQEQAIKENILFCVRSLPCEEYCVPKELRYEMFRSTRDDLPYRGKWDFWMGWAVVDPLPFLYFLQYKVYSQLRRPADKQTALDDLIQTINTEPNLGHRETAFNLLGQCMEQENRWHETLMCYKFSLNVRPRNNAAKWHIGRMLLHCFQNR